MGTGSMVTKTTFTIKLLRIFGTTWVVVVSVIIALSLLIIWKEHGIGEILRIMSPFNIINFMVTLVALAPGIGALVLADNIERRSR